MPIEGGEVVAVSLTDAVVLWSVKAALTASPTTGDGLLFLPTTGAIVARDAVTGGPRWALPIDGRLAAPLVWQDGWLLAGTDRGVVLMLRATTGERLWERALDAPLRVGAALTGDRVYVPLENGHLLALGLQRGETLWDRGLRTRVTALTPLDDRLFVGGDDKFFYCLDARDGDVKWRWRTGGTVVGTPSVDEDNVYFIALDNVLRALRRGNGHQRWRASVPFRPLAGPYVIRGLLVIAGLVEMRAYQPSDGTEAGTFDVPQVLAAPPHVVATDAAADARPLVLVTRESEVRLLQPLEPPLEAKPFPPTPVYPMWPPGGAEPSPLDSRPFPPTPVYPLYPAWPGTGASTSALTTRASRLTPSTIRSFVGSENDSRMRFPPDPSTKNALPAT